MCKAVIVKPENNEMFFSIFSYAEEEELEEYYYKIEKSSQKCPKSVIGKQ